MGKIVVILDGPDAERALDELVSNAEYDKLNLAIWIADEPFTLIIDKSSLAYAHGLDKESK